MTPSAIGFSSAPTTTNTTTTKDDTHYVPSKHNRQNIEFGFGTRAIHVGSQADPQTGAVIPSISLSTTYKQEAIGVHKGFEYSRSGNPNRNALEQTLASIESGGAHALAFSSGSATTATLIQSLGPNSHILSINDVYGGTFRYMTRVATLNQTVKASFVDLENADQDEDVLRSQFRPETKLVWIETPTNPTLRVVDLKRITEIVKSFKNADGQSPLVLVDNTFLSPFYQSPLDLGADVVMHSITKYINGHSDVVMGALVLPAHHVELAEKLRFFQNAIGAVPSPYDCWLAQRGIKTLHLRMKQHGRNALRLAQWLDTEGRRRGWVEDVVYPGLGVSSFRGADDQSKKKRKRTEVAWKSLSTHARRWIVEDLWASSTRSGSVASNDSASSSQTDLSVLSDNSIEDLTLNVDPIVEGFPYGGMISFRIAPPPSSSGLSLLDAAQKFLTSTQLFTLAESLGGVESLAELPALMTHGSIPPAERELLGISEGLIRLSVGVEEGEDLVRDVELALRRVFEGQHGGLKN